MTLTVAKKLITDRSASPEGWRDRLDTGSTATPRDADSISDLADRLGRNYSDVHGDVQVLAVHHIVYFDTDARTQRPVIPYDRVRVDIEVVGDSSTERAHA